MEGVVVYGALSAEEIQSAIARAYPDKSIKVFASRVEPTVLKIMNPKDVIVANMEHEAQYNVLLQKLEEKEQELAEAEESAKKAIISIQTLHKQQQALFDEFVLLRERYDEQKASVVNILWSHCAKFHPDLRQIPPMEDPATFVETPDLIGNLIVGEQLGEGQFAQVRSCNIEGSDVEFALKIIKKERITTFTSLMRVSNEIDNLRSLRSPFVVSVAQVIHTQRMLYIVTERGGRDLFEFFDEHPNGVPESWAKEIIACVLKGVLYCHDQSICHRDLKPENILLSFDTHTERCIDLKLCDFGLSTKFKQKAVLTDFCGSPGFFAPEMIIQGAYFGDKADVWSIGCILLELMMGHEKFCDVWMSAYDYEILQNKEQFTDTIHETVEHLPEYLSFCDDLNGFILKFLAMKPHHRPTVRGLCAHHWLHGLLDEELMRPRMGRMMSDGAFSPMLSPKGSFSLEEAAAGKESSINQDMLRDAYNNLSDKERRQMEEYFAQNRNDPEGMHLPPIVPATPSIVQAKKFLRTNGHDHHHLSNTFPAEASSPVPNGKINPLPTLREDLSTNESFSMSVSNDSQSQLNTLYLEKPRLLNSQSSGDVRK